MSILVREATPNDYPSVLLLIKELAAFQKTREKVQMSLEQMNSDHGLFHCFVAENESGGIIGIAIYFFAWFSWVGKSLYLDDLCVKASARGQSAGKKLLNKIFETAQKENCKRVRWQVSDWNNKAIEFYEKCGAAFDKEVYNCDFDSIAIASWKQLD